jgi:hypothetical protein
MRVAVAADLEPERPELLDVRHGQEVELADLVACTGTRLVEPARRDEDRCRETESTQDRRRRRQNAPEAVVERESHDRSARLGRSGEERLEVDDGATAREVAHLPLERSRGDREGVRRPSVREIRDSVIDENCPGRAHHVEGRSSILAEGGDH